eukprot:CAMPEP_0181191434 /NCGR_PEP_ID=MMETSP1096-20121128/12733_1 /TAXON_ID=156174 ORGANISM="Chrysochromulina ericina, Strain CCMP281" /NCGR_SAMPLE_ID=MMETSP1096 /ASSEMBLY_ACC=CAM_ASM_000453 /LENGTH=65 /DNA_ID=CAMNT_0023280733 /DNA_START=383 /DNA_END=577 /DNA_ORIENTATION=+
MAEGDEIVLIDKRDDAAAIGLGHREEVLEDDADPLANLGREIVQDDVRRGLRDVCRLRYVVSHHN